MFYLVLFCNATASAFIGPAASSLVPQIVPLKIFSNAAAWLSSGFQVGSVLGPALGGWMIALMAGASAVYGCTALGILCFCGFVWFMEVPERKISSEPVTFKTLAVGAHFIWNTPVILGALTLDLFAVLFGGAVALLPIFARDILNAGPTGLGILRSAPSIGALLMTFVLTRTALLSRAGKALLWSVIGFGIATIGFGLSRTFWLSALMLGLTGALDNISVIIRNTLVMVRTPDAMRGRVQAVNNMFISISNELGWFESGLTAWLFGPVISVVGGGIGTLLVVLAAAKKWPEIVRLRGLTPRPDKR